jgi:hypothetical protein
MTGLSKMGFPHCGVTEGRKGCRFQSDDELRLLSTHASEQFYIGRTEDFPLSWESTVEM